MGSAITASNVYMDALNIRNSQSNQIVRVARVVLQVIVRYLTTQQEVSTCCYILHCLLGDQCSLVEALRPQVVDSINKDFTLFSLQMAMSHCCTAFAYNVSYIIGNYLNSCVKVLVTVSPADPGRRIPVSIQYMMDELRYYRYMGRLTPSVPWETPPRWRHLEGSGG